MLLSVLLQFAVHIVTLIYITDLSKSIEDLGQGRDLEKKFGPSLLNTSIYLLGLSQQVSTFVLNFQVGYRVHVESQLTPCRADLSERVFERTRRSTGVSWESLE